MPRIDPNQLLKCLSILLSPIGGIKSREEVQRLVSLMSKFSKKLVSKCIYVLILKSTDADLLDMFMSAGGWDLTYSWLSDGITMKNWPLVVELVELLLLCPVDIERLKGNNCPKLIKLLSKDPTATEKVRQLACNVVDQWLAIVKGACEASKSPTQSDTTPIGEAENGDVQEDLVEETPPSRGVYKITIRNGKNVLAEVISSDRASPRVGVMSPEEATLSGELESPEGEPPVEETLARAEEQEMEFDEDDDEVPSRRSSAKKSLEKKSPTVKRKAEKKSSLETEKKSSTKEKKKISPEKKPRLDLKKSKEREKERKSLHSEKREKSQSEKLQEEKDKQSLMKLITPSIGGLGKIPKKNREDSSKKDEKKQQAVLKPPDEPKKIPKDPKKYNISIETRKGGEERPKIVKTFNSRFRSTGLEELPPPPRSAKKKEEVDKKSSLKRSSPVKDVVLPEKKIKEEEKSPVPATPPKPKVSGLQESDVFADALTAAQPVKDVKKRKRRPSVCSTPPDVKKECTTVKTEEPPGDDKQKEEKPVFKFYQDTLITSEDKNEKAEPKEIKEESPSEEEKVAEEDADTLSKEEIEDEVAKAEKAIDQVLKLEEKKNMEREKNRIPKGVLVFVKKNKILKKSVSWKPDKDLESVQFFELDETERVNVTKPFVDMKQMERTNERRHLTRKLASEDVMEEKTSWRSLIPVDVAGDLVVSGKNSLEKDIQHGRERTVLQAVYFGRNQIPDSPAEPDLEIHATTEPALIPLEDQSGNADSVISYKDKPWPEPKGYPPGGGGGSPPRGVPGVVPMETNHLPTGVMGVQEPPQLLHHPQAPIGGPMAMFPPQQCPPQPMRIMPPYMPPDMMPPPNPGEWMGNPEGGGMMMGGGPVGGGGEMMMGMPPGMHPGAMMPGPPDMYPPQMGGPPPDFMGPPFPGPGPHMGPPPPGMFQHGYPPGGPPPGPPHHSGERPQRPWFRGQNGGGTWRHPSKGGGGWNQNSKACKYYMKKGFCRQPSCSFRHGPGKGNNR